MRRRPRQPASRGIGCRGTGRRDREQHRIGCRPRQCAGRGSCAAERAAAGARHKETPKERRAREREREARLASAAAALPRPAAPAATGIVRIAVSPWGEIEVDGRPAGTSPPVTELNLPAGRHQIVVRNADLPAYSSQVNVAADQPVSLKHKF